MQQFQALSHHCVFSWFLQGAEKPAKPTQSCLDQDQHQAPDLRTFRYVSRVWNHAIIATILTL